jgi:hypothetical protein
MANEPRTYSTKEAAKKVGISYITLRRWLAAGDFRPSIAVEFGPSKKLWRFTGSDIAVLHEFTDEMYCKGRGRVGLLKKEVSKERNRRKAAKRFWKRALGSKYPEVAKRWQKEERDRRGKG